MIRMALIVLALALGGVALACGSGDGGDETPTAVSTPDPNFTPEPVGLLTPQPPPDIDPEMDLTEYVETELNPPFAISHPADWPLNKGPQQVQFTWQTPDRGYIGNFSVGCISGESPEAARNAVADLLRRVQARWSPGASTPMEIDGKPALLFSYSVNLGAINSQVRVYFVQGTRCIWQLQGNVVALPPFDDVERLFQRIAESFRELPGE